GSSREAPCRKLSFTWLLNALMLHISPFRSQIGQFHFQTSVVSVAPSLVSFRNWNSRSPRQSLFPLMYWVIFSEEFIFFAFEGRSTEQTIRKLDVYRINKVLTFSPIPVCYIDHPVYPKFIC